MARLALYGLLYGIMCGMTPAVFSFAASAQITQGPNNPGTVTTGACSFSYSSTLGYAPTANVITSNNVYATATHCACCDANTNCLTLSNFGFTIPAGATISGIKVEIEKKASFGAVIQDNGLRLMKAGAESGSNYANFGVNWPTFDTYSVYGGCTDLWGTTWTAADINAANFGLYFAAIDYTCGGNTISSIDHVRVSVCYFSTLPVELVSFNAARENESVVLKWIYANEPGLNRFEIERSLNGIDFVKAGEVFQTDSLHTTHAFSFADTGVPVADLYYRLRRVDLNGQSDFSEMIFVPMPAGNWHVENIAWNSGTLKLHVETATRQETALSLFTADGKTTWNGSFVAEKGDHWYEIQVNAGDPGFYLLQFRPRYSQPVTKRIMRNSFE